LQVTIDLFGLCRDIILADRIQFHVQGDLPGDVKGFVNLNGMGITKGAVQIAWSYRSFHNHYLPLSCGIQFDVKTFGALSLLLEDNYPHDTCALFLINGYIRDLNSQAYELSYFM
jgi:hypothetical protein